MNVRYNWYMRDVFRWRTGASVAWSLLLLPPAVSLYVLLTHLDLLHPFRWILGCLLSCFSLSGIAYITFIVFCAAIVSILNAFSYSLIPQIHRNRLSIILSVTRPGRLLHAIGHTLLGGLIGWACCKLIGGRYAALSIECKNQAGALCLNDHHLFLVLFAAYLGVVYSVSHFLHRSNLLTFSIIQQMKFFQVKSNLLPSLASNALGSLRLCAYFYLTFYFLGCLLKSWLLTNLRLYELPTPVDSIRGLLDIRLFWQAWLLGTLLTHSWKSALYLFKVFNTEVFEFPIEAAFNMNQEMTLHRALGQRGIPLVQHLAYQDLSLLAEHSPARRKQIFSLSQPGGHPHNWNRISTECLDLLASLTDRLLIHQERAANGLAKEKRMLAEEKRKRSGSMKQRGSSSSYFTATTPHEPRQRIATLSTTSMTTPVQGGYSQGCGTPYSPATPSWSQAPATPGQDSVLVDPPANHSYTPLVSPRKPIRDTQRGRDNRGSTDPVNSAPYPPRHRLLLLPRPTALRQLVLFRYFMDPFPEAESRALFTDAQLHIWALEALSSLVAASYLEDSFGVVQSSLPDILAEMLALHNALEKLFKLPTPLTSRDPRELKVTRIGPAHPDDQLRNDLRTTVKTSLHRITSTFGHHIKSVPLAPEYRKQLTELMEYKL
ncbi:nucleoporin NDC1-like [Diadema antillarum]|uniref:nucleoporin NDC1-like n=1 Tax=Diadema antillarum TaxID=105358 RepID=UPI003A84DC0F